MNTWNWFLYPYYLYQFRRLNLIKVQGLLRQHKKDNGFLYFGSTAQELAVSVIQCAFVSFCKFRVFLTLKSIIQYLLSAMIKIVVNPEKAYTSFKLIDSHCYVQAFTGFTVFFEILLWVTKVLNWKKTNKYIYSYYVLMRANICLNRYRTSLVENNLCHDRIVHLQDVDAYFY